MPAPSPSRSQRYLSLPAQSQQPKPDPIRRRGHRTFIFKKLAILALLLLVLLGCASEAPRPDSWTRTQAERVEAQWETICYKRASLSAPLTWLASLREGAAKPPPPKLYRVLALSTLTPASLPPPTPTRQPLSTVPRNMIDTPPPPRPSSTASPLPIATDTPLPAPTPTSTALPALDQTEAVTAATLSEIAYVVIITIDGLRPDALELADTPVLDGLRANGAYYPGAQTVNPSFTLPAHVSMLTGVLPRKHGIVEALPCIGCRLSIGPTLFSVAHDAGLSTGMVFGKQKLDYLVLPNSVDQLFGTDTHDPVIKKEAIEIIQAGLPNVLFIHFPDVDRVGHAYNWMSTHQYQAINYVDGLIGEIVAELKSSGYLSRTLLIVTADHGGHGKRHGDDSPIDRTIPWLAVGPGVQAGVTLSRPINIYDTTPTVLYALKLPIPERCDGQPILEIFQPQFEANLELE